MNQLNLTGLLLIGGFVLIILASTASPPRLYQESDSQIRLKIIADHHSRWVLSNMLFVLGGLTTAAGLLLFSVSVPEAVNPLLNWLALLAYMLGTAAWIIFIINRTVNPAQLFEDYTFSPLTIALVGLLLISLLLYGLIYLQAGYPNWLGFGTAGAAVLIALIALFFPERFFASFPPQILYMFTLVAGIMFIRN